MTNLRIVSNNLADSGTTTMSSTSGTFVAANLRSDIKALVARSPYFAARVSQNFTAPQTIGLVALAYANLSPTATARVRMTNEAAATNLFTFSDYPENAAWTKSSTTVGTTYAVAPDGIFQARLVSEAAATANHSIRLTATVAASSTYTFSFYVKPSGRTNVQINNGTTGAAGNINLTTGVITSGGTGFVSADRTVLNDGWYRVSMVFLSGAGGAQNFLLFLASAPGTYNYLGDGVSGVFTYGWQLELGSLTSYYPSAQTLTTRASAATYIDVNGLIASAATNVARNQYQFPSLGAVAPRLLVETAATNLMLYSELLSNAAYTKGGTTIGSAVTAPDGASTALSITDTTNNSLHYISQSISITSGVTYTYSAFVKPSTLSRLQLFAGAGAFVNFNLTAGTAGTTGGTGYVDSRIWPMANGYYRVSLTFTANATSSQPFYILLADAAGNTTYAGVGGLLYAWGLQCEVGTMATSYVATTTVAVTRAADVFTSAAGTRPLGYMDWWQSYAYDSGAVLCCPAPALTIPGYTAAQSASLYQYNGGTHARVWCTPTSAIAVAVDISDPANLQGYVEFSRLIMGDYWEPTKNADYGASVTPMDMSKGTRSDTGDLITDIAPRYNKVSFTLSKLDPVDRTKAWNLLKGSGTARSLFFSLYPNDSDTTLESAHQVYGRLVTVPSMATPFFNLASASIDIEGV